MAWGLLLIFIMMKPSPSNPLKIFCFALLLNFTLLSSCADIGSTSQDILGGGQTTQGTSDQGGPDGSFAAPDENPGSAAEGNNEGENAEANPASNPFEAGASEGGAGLAPEPIDIPITIAKIDEIPHPWNMEGNLAIDDATGKTRVLLTGLADAMPINTYLQHGVLYNTQTMQMSMAPINEDGSFLTLSVVLLNPNDKLLIAGYHEDDPENPNDKNERVGGIYLTITSQGVFEWTLKDGSSLYTGTRPQIIPAEIIPQEVLEPLPRERLPARPLPANQSIPLPSQNQIDRDSFNQIPGLDIGLPQDRRL